MSQTELHPYEAVRKKARDRFEEVGLHYEDIKAEDIDLLIHMLRQELLAYLNSGSEHAKSMRIKVREPLKKDIKVLKKGLKYAYLQIDGSYFSKREAISFHENGVIGFCCEMSGVNAVPILTAFHKWCDALDKRTEQEKNQKLVMMQGSQNY